MIYSAGKAVIQKINEDIFIKHNLQIYVLRLDQAYPGISGNKWFKLKYNLEEAKSQGYNTILTFGGAYSNHIHATAIAASEAGFKSVGIIRGERIEPLNPTLKDALDEGMKLHFISRDQFRNKNNKSFLDELKKRFGNYYLIPEGGTNRLAIKGASEILNEISIDFDVVITPVGTGGTIAGIIAGQQGEKQIIGISVLKGGFLTSIVENLVIDYCGRNYNNWSILEDYHFGGYAKFTDSLISFINRFKEIQKIPLDPVYTGKMMFALYDQEEKGYFEPGLRILAIHTGGLQGIRGFNQRFGNLIR